MRLLLSLFLLALLAFATYLGVCWAYTQYTLLPPAEQPRMALIAVLALLCALTLSGAIRYAAREQAQGRLLEQRYRLYQLALGVLQSEAPSPALQAKVGNGLALLGSKEVIRAYRQLEAAIGAQNPGASGVEEQLKVLTLAMRSDLGQSNFDISTELKTLLPGKPSDHS